MINNSLWTSKINKKDYKSYWRNFIRTKSFVFKDDFKQMHDALLLFETYCDEHSDDMDDMQFLWEVDAMIHSFQIKQTKRFAVCHQDDFLNYYPDEDVDYCFCWDAGNIIWNFLGGYHGDIWI